MMYDVAVVARLEDLATRELLPAQNVYVEELVKIVPGILCHPHCVIFTSISV